MNEWICLKCGHEVMADRKPAPIKWTDGHVCYFVRNDVWPETPSSLPEERKES